MPLEEERVLLTGASGFIASHILAQLLEQGYKVTATVRSPSKAQQILDLHPDWKENVTFAFVPDVIAPGAFNELFKSQTPGFSYIIHTASPVTFTVEDVKRDLIDPAVRGTTEILKAAHEFGGRQVKRLVLLGSAVAIMNSFEDINVEGKPYTEKDWNPVTEAQAVQSQNPVWAYNVGKALAERAAWDFLDKEKPVFDLTVINPDIIIGPMIQPIQEAKSVNTTNVFACYSFFNGERAKEDISKTILPYWHFVDVRDVARAHILSLTNPAASGQRIILVSGLITPQLVANTIRKNFPSLRDRVPEGKPEQILPDDIKPTGWDTSKSHEIFGKDWKYIDLETSLVDTVKSLLDLEKKWSG